MKAVICLILLLSPVLSFSQTIHFILFAATNDFKVGAASDAALRYFQYEFVPLLGNVGFNVRPQFFAGSDFTRSNMDNVVSNLRTNSNDIIIFYYTGHGYNNCSAPNPNDYPTLLVGANDGENVPGKSKAEMDVFNVLRTKPHKLLLTIAESCNNCDRRNAPAIPRMVSYDAADVDVIKFKNLFLSSGDYLVSSSRKGESSYGLQIGFFTGAFVDVLKEETAKDGQSTPSWNSIFNKTATRTTNDASKSTDDNGNQCIQHPQFTAYGSQIASTEPMLTAAKRVLNNVLNNGNYVGNYQNGRGGMKWRNDTQYYFGEFQDGQPNGVGICISYDNIWMGVVKTENNNMSFGSDTYIYDGKGVRKSNGAHSVGYSWNSTLKLIRTKKGNYYFGQVDVNGYYQGYGMFVWQDGRAWVGTFKNGQQEQGGYIN